MQPETENYKFVQNTDCEYFPCHQGIPENDFNCLFCFCPLYCLQENCGGNFKKTDEIKDCSDCLLVHNKNSYEYIMSKIKEVIKTGSEF